jgi:hypothetical protein
VDGGVISTNYERLTISSGSSITGERLLQAIKDVLDGKPYATTTSFLLIEDFATGKGAPR